jgi:hypothetical protein
MLMTLPNSGSIPAPSERRPVHAQQTCGSVRRAPGERRRAVSTHWAHPMPHLHRDFGPCHAFRDLSRGSEGVGLGGGCGKAAAAGTAYCARLYNHAPLLPPFTLAHPPRTLARPPARPPTLPRPTTPSTPLIYFWLISLTPPPQRPNTNTHTTTHQTGTLTHTRKHLLGCILPPVVFVPPPPTGLGCHSLQACRANPSVAVQLRTRGAALTLQRRR